MSSRNRHQQSGTTTDSAVVLSRLRRESTRIKRRELDTALRKLDASGDLSERERAVLEEMADRIVARLLEPPTAALEESASGADSAEPEVLARLFEPAIEQDGVE